jgi:hypothetical protein
MMNVSSAAFGALASKYGVRSVGLDDGDQQYSLVLDEGRRQSGSSRCSDKLRGGEKVRTKVVRYLVFEGE